MQHGSPPPPTALSLAKKPLSPINREEAEILALGAADAAAAAAAITDALPPPLFFWTTVS